MKILFLVSSYRRDGNTEGIVRLIEKELLILAEKENIALEIERVQLAASDIRVCRGCRVCFDYGEDKCPLKDDLLPIRDKLLQADGILAASPVYVEDINGIMKNWIDRMAFVCHRPAFAGKSVYVVTTSGGGATSHSLKTMMNAFMSWGAKVAGKHNFSTGGLMDAADMEGKHGGQAKAAAQALYGSIRANSTGKPSFQSLMVFKVQQKAWLKTARYHGTYDYKYWEGKGWLDKECDFYIPHHANPVKVALSHIAAAIIARIFV